MIIRLSDTVKNSIKEQYALFIEKYMEKLPANHSVMYLYCLKNKGEDLTTSSLAEKFSLPEKEATDMLNYLSLLSIVEIKGNTATVTGVLEEASKSAKKPPEYTVEEITYIKSSNDEVKRLISESERLLGRFLSYNDLKTIYSFYDFYKLPVDVIIILTEYCVKRDKRNLSYIEKSVIDWAESGIDTVEKAKLRIESFNSESLAIMKAMGINGRAFTPTENDYIRKWKKDGLSLEMIVLACEKAAIKTGKSSFPYADTILSSWKEKGISTQEEAKAEEEAFSNRFSKTETKAPAKNQFNNFKQRSYDYKALEKMLFNKYNKNGEDK